jgi:hypothetical protein
VWAESTRPVGDIKMESSKGGLSAAPRISGVFRGTWTLRKPVTPRTTDSLGDPDKPFDNEIVIKELRLFLDSLR